MADRNKSKSKSKSHGKKSVGRIADGLPDTLSKQQRYQIRKRLAGLCVRCGKSRNLYALICDLCHEKAMEEQRRRNGYKPWKPGSTGRPPLTVKLGCA